MQTWLQGLREQWGEEPDDWERRLKALAGFCAFAEKDPDTVIKEWHRGGNGRGEMPAMGADDDGPPFTGGNASPTMEKAMDEAEDAANRVLAGEQTVHLTPQRSYIRRLQHLLGQRYNVASVSQGREPERAVMFYRV